MDINILLWFQEHRTGLLDAVMKVFTLLGNETVAIGLVCLFFWCMKRREGNRMLLSMFSGLIVSQFIKIIFAIERPWIRDPRVKPAGAEPDANGVLTGGAIDDATAYSFPSGHSANAATCYGGFAHDKKPWVKIVAWIVVILIGISRMYLGVHTLQDVLVAILMGVAFVILMDKLSAALEVKPDLDIPVVIVSLLLSGATLGTALIRLHGAPPDVNTIDAFKLAGATVGAMVGWILERRIVKFEQPTSILKGAVRFVVGLLVTLAFLKLPKTVLNNVFGEIIGSILRYGLTCFVAMFVYPVVFKKLNF